MTSELPVVNAMTLEILQETAEKYREEYAKLVKDIAQTQLKLTSLEEARDACEQSAKDFDILAEMLLQHSLNQPRSLT